MARKEANFSDQAMKSINDFRKEGFLCDVTLNVRGVPFNAHRNVLAASSPYFKALFTSEMRENQDNTIQINDLNTQIMEDILTYLYSGTVILTESNAIELTVAADYMFLPKLKKMSTEFVSQNLTAANCLGVLSIAEKYAFKDLCEEAQKYTLENFATVSQGEDFEKLSVEQLIAIISCDDLVAKEMEVFEAIVRWTNLQIDDRKKHFDALFSHVRLIFLPRCYILDVVKEENLVKNSESCQSALQKTDEFFQSSSQERQNNKPPFNPRTCQNGVLLLGGWLETNKITNAAQVFVPYLAEFFDLAPMLFPRKNHGVAVHEGVVYVVGGSSMQESAVRSVELYDARSNTWSSVMSLCKESAGLGVVCHGNYIYAIGGHDAVGQHLNVVQRYDPKLNTWEFMEPMRDSRTHLCVVAADAFIYAIGGFSNEVYHPLNTCECYSPETNLWYKKTPMKSRRSGACATYINEKIYVIGGEDVLDMPYIHDACEVYTPETDTWTAIAPMCVARSHAAVAVIKNKLFVFGGVNKGRELHGVEYYDTVKCQWEVFTRLKTAVEGLGCCVITVPGELLRSIL
ncbi:kelch-like protein diablo [Actinia tenebrosa]|uniref:Kelch-like protein diablo n=1 Tax=Actinia tenebrosa TaxID=6105 RepID=A0A6P8IZ42_ACTTE|nr:kelch-like protein diablo [Actinia tenebrosa]